MGKDLQGSGRDLIQALPSKTTQFQNCRCRSQNSNLAPAACEPTALPLHQPAVVVVVVVVVEAAAAGAAAAAAAIVRSTSLLDLQRRIA